MPKSKQLTIVHVLLFREVEVQSFHEKSQTFRLFAEVSEKMIYKKKRKL